MRDTLFFHQSETALGTMTVTVTARGIRGLIFTEGAKKGRMEAQAQHPDAVLKPLAARNARARQWVRAVEAYLGGKDGLPDVPLDIGGTAFQKKVWKRLCTIPAGKTISYGEVARAIGSPAAVRAVAGACAANRIALLIPCHRVRRKDGTPGGFRWGLRCKQALLLREAAAGKAA